MTDLLVRGHHGLGDNIHQRALVRQLMERSRVFLETPWPSVYWDMVGEDLHVIDRGSTLRTQAKNAARERALFSQTRPHVKRAQTLGYPVSLVREHGSVLRAMLVNSGVDPKRCDFSLPIKPEWEALADEWLSRWSSSKPLMLLRPLVERAEWGGAAARNPDPGAYNALYGAVRERYFTVSLADLAPGQEWLVGPEFDADVKLHAGELVFEAMAALFARADLVFTAPGFAVVLAQAVGAKHVAVFGGYERAYSFSAGWPLAEQLAIEPVEPCDCFRHDHGCEKAIDLADAHSRLEGFLAA